MYALQAFPAGSEFSDTVYGAHDVGARIFGGKESKVTGVMLAQASSSDSLMALRHKEDFVCWLVQL